MKNILKNLIYVIGFIIFAIVSNISLNFVIKGVNEIQVVKDYNFERSEKILLEIKKDQIVYNNSIKGRFVLDPLYKYGEIARHLAKLSWPPVVIPKQEFNNPFVYDFEDTCKTVLSAYRGSLSSDMRCVQIL